MLQTYKIKQSKKWSHLKYFNCLKSTKDRKKTIKKMKPPKNILIVKKDNLWKIKQSKKWSHLKIY